MWTCPCAQMRECKAVSRFANLADKQKASTKDTPDCDVSPRSAGPATTAVTAPAPPSRIGRKAIAAYFSPEMSLAMHVCARKRDISLQELMAEAFDDVLRKYGKSPIGG